MTKIPKIYEQIFFIFDLTFTLFKGMTMGVVCMIGLGTSGMLAVYGKVLFGCIGVFTVKSTMYQVD